MTYNSFLRGLLSWANVMLEESKGQLEPVPWAKVIGSTLISRSPYDMVWAHVYAVNLGLPSMPDSEKKNRRTQLESVLPIKVVDAIMGGPGRWEHTKCCISPDFLENLETITANTNRAF